MHPRTPLRAARSLSVVTAALLIATSTPAYAHVEPATPDNSAPLAGISTVFTITDTLARQVANALRDQGARDRIVSAVNTGPADLLELEAGRSLAQQSRAANHTVLVAKGLPATTGSVLRLRLAHPDLRADLNSGRTPLVAAAPSDDEPTSVTAYDQTGRAVALDPVRLPTRAVLVVEVDTERALAAGLKLIDSELARHGLRDTSRTGDVTAAGGYWATKVNAVRLNNDQEPWIKGAAEIFNLVAGFGHDGKVTVNAVQMPYLDHDKTTYYPNQLLVHFKDYKYNLADVVMMEDDGDTNYQALVTALISALLFIVDGGAYTPLVNAILNALPTSWWTDDPDYVDSWYTLSTSSSGRKWGASANGYLDVVPYWVSEL